MRRGGGRGSCSRRFGAVGCTAECLHASRIPPPRQPYVRKTVATAEKLILPTAWYLTPGGSTWITLSAETRGVWLVFGVVALASALPDITIAATSTLATAGAAISSLLIAEPTSAFYIAADRERSFDLALMVDSSGKPPSPTGSSPTYIGLVHVSSDVDGYLRLVKSAGAST